MPALPLSFLSETNQNHYGLLFSSCIHLLGHQRRCKIALAVRSNRDHARTGTMHEQMLPSNTSVTLLFEGKTRPRFHGHHCDRQGKGDGQHSPWSLCDMMLGKGSGRSAAFIAAGICPGRSCVSDRRGQSLVATDLRASAQCNEAVWAPSFKGVFRERACGGSGENAMAGGQRRGRGGSLSARCRSNQQVKEQVTTTRALSSGSRQLISICVSLPSNRLGTAKAPGRVQLQAGVCCKLPRSIVLLK